MIAAIITRADTSPQSLCIPPSQAEAARERFRQQMSEAVRRLEHDEDLLAVMLTEILEMEHDRERPKANYRRCAIIEKSSETAF